MRWFFRMAVPTECSRGFHLPNVAENVFYRVWLQASPSESSWASSSFLSSGWGCPSECFSSTVQLWVAIDVSYSMAPDVTVSVQLLDFFHTPEAECCFGCMGSSSFRELSLIHI